MHILVRIHFVEIGADLKLLLLYGSIYLCNAGDSRVAINSYVISKGSSCPKLQLCFSTLGFSPARKAA